MATTYLSCCDPVMYKQGHPALDVQCMFIVIYTLHICMMSFVQPHIPKSNQVNNTRRWPLLGKPSPGEYTKPETSIDMYLKAMARAMVREGSEVALVFYNKFLVNAGPWASTVSVPKQSRMSNGHAQVRESCSSHPRAMRSSWFQGWG